VPNGTIVDGVSAMRDSSGGVTVALYTTARSRARGPGTFPDATRYPQVTKVGTGNPSSVRESENARLLANEIEARLRWLVIRSANNAKDGGAHMAVPKHSEEAATRLKAAAARIDAARAKPLKIEHLQEWLAALTDFSLALSDVHAFNNESIHEKLHELAGRAGLREFPPAVPRRG
jgi:hypothetical protein